MKPSNAESEQQRKTAYQLWLVLGLLGAHRFYLDRLVSGGLHSAGAGLGDSHGQGQSRRDVDAGRCGWRVYLGCSAPEFIAACARSARVFANFLEIYP